MRIVQNDDRPESLRATALALLRDIGSDAARPLYVDLVCGGPEGDELSEMAADILSDGDGAEIGDLLARYDEAPEYAQMRILGVCTNFPGDGRTYDYLLDKLRNRPEQRALYASFLGKLGDARAIDAIRPFLSMADISYLDYIELRNAVEELGGDPGEERTFYGDPDYEAMRNM